MGIYINGMEMPETCKLCYLSEFDPGFYAYVCKPIGMWIDYDMAKTDRPRRICPLVPVPPHGRLGDLDELAKRIEHDRYNHTHTDGLAARHHVAEYGHFLKAISDAPTIIPAEEGET